MGIKYPDAVYLVTVMAVAHAATVGWISIINRATYNARGYIWRVVRSRRHLWGLSFLLGAVLLIATDNFGLAVLGPIPALICTVIDSVCIYIAVRGALRR